MHIFSWNFSLENSSLFPTNKEEEFFTNIFLVNSSLFYTARMRKNFPRSINRKRSLIIFLQNSLLFPQLTRRIPGPIWRKNSPIITIRKKLSNDNFLPSYTQLDDGCPTIIEACVKKFWMTIYVSWILLCIISHEFVMHTW